MEFQKDTVKEEDSIFSYFPYPASWNADVIMEGQQLCWAMKMRATL